MLKFLPLFNNFFSIIIIYLELSKLEEVKWKWKCGKDISAKFSTFKAFLFSLNFSYLIATHLKSLFFEEAEANSFLYG
jgi:hypothetical protein